MLTNATSVARRGLECYAEVLRMFLSVGAALLSNATSSEDGRQSIACIISSSIQRKINVPCWLDRGRTELLNLNYTSYFIRSTPVVFNSPKAHQHTYRGMYLRLDT